MTAQDQEEVANLQRQFDAYVGNLIASGLSPAVVTTALLGAASERVLLASTPTQTAAWLRGHALAIEKFGPAMLEAARAG